MPSLHRSHSSWSAVSHASYPARTTAGNSHPVPRGRRNRTIYGELRRLPRRPPGNRTRVAGAEAQMHAPAPTAPQRASPLKSPCPRGQVRARTIPEGELLYRVEYPIRLLRNAVVTSDNTHLVLAGNEALKDTLFVYNATTGVLLNKIVLKYANYKDFHQIVRLADRVNYHQVVEYWLRYLRDVVTVIDVGIFLSCR